MLVYELTRMIHALHRSLKRERIALKIKWWCWTSIFQIRFESWILRQNNTLENARRTLLEAESSGLGTMDELQRQRESLESSRAKVQDTISLTNQAKSVLDVCSSIIGRMLLENEKESLVQAYLKDLIKDCIVERNKQESKITITEKTFYSSYMTQTKNWKEKETVRTNNMKMKRETWTRTEKVIKTKKIKRLGRIKIEGFYGNGKISTEIVFNWRRIGRGSGLFGFVEVQEVHIFVLIIGREETFGICVDRIFNIIHIHNIIFYIYKKKRGMEILCWGSDLFSLHNAINWLK